MRICYVANAQSVHIQSWAKYFAENGHDVHLISFLPPDKPIEGVQVYAVDPHSYVRKYLAYSPLVFKLAQIKKFVRTIKPDILHGHYLTDYGFSAAWTGYKPLIVR